jgi:cytokinesis protein
MVKDYNEIRSGLQKLIQELETHYDDDYESPDGDNFVQVMKNFRDDAIEKFEELEVIYTSMDVAYRDVVGYYGENPDQMKPDEFFGIFKTFTSSWEVKQKRCCFFATNVHNTKITIIKSVQ